jgi:outer membrane protein OmpA-like peptidoglycan-associated protein
MAENGAKRHRPRALAIAVAAVLAVPTVARAQTGDEPRDNRQGEDPAYGRELRFEVSAYGGYRFFAHEHSLGRNPATMEASPGALSPANAGTFGLRLDLNFNRWVGLEAELGGYPTHTNNHQTNLWIFGYRGSLIVHLSPYYRFRPFLLLGYGGLSSLVANDAAPASGNSAAQNDTYGFLHAGLGFKIGFTDMTGLRLEGRINGPWTALDPVIPRGNRVVASGPDYELLGGFYLAFGEIQKERYYSHKEVRVVAPPPEPKPKDRDGDGILDAADKCADAPEDRDGFEDDDGCPDPDNDKDGIPDPRDKCPGDPEDKDGFHDDDGCPEPDNDTDGLLDANDKCPIDPEDRDGFQDEDGCPDPDNDKDGIPDGRDKCPNDPETKNAFQDDDGCPDEIPKEVKQFTGVIEGINFETASANILPGSYGLLDRAVKVLTTYPDLMIEISGHTDSRGNADYNRDLSTRRAESVRQYLLTRGIEPRRIVAIGYGMDRPIATNKTDAGRASNRRIEFRLITAEERK